MIVLLKLGKKTNSSIAHNKRENVSKEDGSREAKHTAANTAAFSDTESDTLATEVTTHRYPDRLTWTFVLPHNCEKSDVRASFQTMYDKIQFPIL